MAFFKLRKSRDEAPPKVAAAPTVEAVRRRAIHRLIGAAVLVLAGVLGFPLIFDNQPRPIPIDLPIDIVDKNKARPLVLPAAGSVESVAPAASEPPPAVATGSAPAGVAVKAPITQHEAAAPAMAPQAPVAPAPVAPPAVAAATAAKAAASSAAELAEAKALDARKARALLEGKSGPAQGNAGAVTKAGAAPAAPPQAVAAKPAATEGRFVVQVGAFSDPAKVREVRRKVESAGLKTYTQVVTTSDGERTRVRVGPFDDKELAVKAADRIRKLNLTVAILTL